MFESLLQPRSNTPCYNIPFLATGDTGITYSIPNSAMISDLFSVTPSGEIVVLGNLRSDDRVLYELEVEATSDECSVRAGVTVRVLRRKSTTSSDRWSVC